MKERYCLYCGKKITREMLKKSPKLKICSQRCRDDLRNVRRNEKRRLERKKKNKQAHLKHQKIQVGKTKYKEQKSALHTTKDPFNDITFTSGCKGRYDANYAPLI